MKTLIFIFSLYVVHGQNLEKNGTAEARKLTQQELENIYQRKWEKDRKKYREARLAGMESSMNQYKKRFKLFADNPGHLEQRKFEAKFESMLLNWGKRAAMIYAQEYARAFARRKKALKEGAKLGAPKNEKPNVIFIMSDDLGYNDISYNSDHAFMPNIDFLANNGMIFDSFYTQPVCTPSRAQFMTGRYTNRYGLQHRNILPAHPSGIPADEKTFPEYFKECGYSTEMIGKWHLGQFSSSFLPQNRGFDHWIGTVNGAGHHVYHRQCFNSPLIGSKMEMCGYDLREGTNKNGVYEDKVRYDLNGTQKVTILTDEFNKIVRRHNKTEPLFAYLSFHAVHTPIVINKKDITQIKDTYQRTNMNCNKKRTQILSMGTGMDRAIGRIVETLQRNNMWENTIIVFANDNGGRATISNNFPYKRNKSSTLEGGIRVPAFIHSNLLPESRRGERTDNLMDMTDWLPTLLSMSQCRARPYADKPLDGIDQSVMIASEIEDVPATGPRDEILHHMDYLKTFSHRNLEDPREFLIPIREELKEKGFNIKFHTGIRYKNWKLLTGYVVFRDYKLERHHLESQTEGSGDSDPTHELGKLVALFDIVEDYREKNDVSEQNPEIVKLLLDKLADYYQSSVDIRFPKLMPEADPKNFNETWTPWIKTAEEHGFNHPLQIQFYNLEIDRLFYSVDMHLVENSEYRSDFKLRKHSRASMRKSAAGNA